MHFKCILLLSQRFLDNTDVLLIVASFVTPSLKFQHLLASIWGKYIVACLEKGLWLYLICNCSDLVSPWGPLKFHLGEKSFNAQWNRECLL